MSTLNKIKVGDTLYNLEDTEARTGLLNKIDKVEGKGLSTNDFTDEDKTKLDELSNYDDTEIREELNDKANKNEIPSVDGLATEEYVNNIIANLPSGSDLSKIEIVADFVIEEEVSKYTVSTIGHKYRRLYISLDAVGSTTNTGSVSVCVNFNYDSIYYNKQSFWFYNIVLNTVHERYGRAIIELLDECGFIQAGLENTSSSLVKNQLTNSQTINTITVATQNGNGVFGVGTKMKIWGEVV